VAAGVENCLVIFEDAIGEVVLAEELPDIFDGIELRRVRVKSEMLSGMSSSASAFS
jgi:hypothetical protein